MCRKQSLTADDSTLIVRIELKIIHRVTSQNNMPYDIQIPQVLQREESSPDSEITSEVGHIYFSTSKFITSV
jgi:hypothetical protein